MIRRFDGREFAVALLGLFLLGTPPPATAQEDGSTSGRTFGADYATLRPAQKDLVDDLYARFGRIMGREIEPEEAYNAVRLSIRTTFDAVTHALTTSTLTDADSGEALGHAIDLIDYVEDVRGKVSGAGGDRQFRIYVRLEPDALERLDRSEEFVRKGDNTIFHKGYPLNYRQEGVPSMQISMTRDGSRADIDVDYRSEKFPASLVNGHLTAANSDIRAGNHGRHNQRWDGLVNWWDDFFGQLFSTDTYGDETDEGREFPLQPLAGDETIDVAVLDFLTSWLVDRQPNLAVAYFDREALDCLATRMADEGLQLDRGLARLQMYVRMKAVSDELGEKRSLEDTVVGVRIVNRNFRLVRQDHHRQFVLQALPRRFAEELKCGSPTKVGELSTERRASRIEEKLEHFLSSFHLKGVNRSGATLNLLWAKREGYWKIVSYEVAMEDEGDEGRMPDMHEDVEVAEMETMEGPPGLAEANEAFLKAWFETRDYDRAMAQISPRALACVNLLRDPGDADLKTPDEQRARLRLGIERTGDLAPEGVRFEDVAKAVIPWDPRLRLVKHSHEEAFGLFGLPNWAGRESECERLVERGAQDAVEGSDTAFGRYFASALRLEATGGEPAVLYLGWNREGDDWKIFAFKVEEP